MSSLDKLRETLATEAAAKAAEVMAEAESRAAGIVAEAEARAKQIGEDILALTRRDVESRLKLAAAEERLLKRQAMGVARAELVERVFGSAIDALAKLPEEKYTDLLARLVAREAPEGRVKVIMNSADRARLGEGFVRKLASGLTAGGRQVELELAAEPGTMVGGVKLIGADFEVDCSLERLVQLAAETVEPEVVRALFG